MKVRHFGLPPTPLLGRTDGAPPAAPAVSKSADVRIEGGALTFPRAAQELSEKSKTERAKVLLETLRAGGESFGGRVQGGVDVAASLRAYFRSLEVAEIAGAHGADAAVTEFLEHLDVPDDVRGLLSLVVDGHEAGPLGNLRDHENDVNTNAMWQRWQRGEHAVHTVTDETVRKWFTQWGAGADINGYLSQGDANFKLGAFRFFARAKELGLNVTANNYAGYLPHLPATDEAARTLGRFARAFGIDPAVIQLGGRPLSSWGVAGRAARRVAGAPLGREARWEKQQPAQWQQAFARADASTVKVNDATVRALAAAGLFNNPHQFVYGAQAQVKQGAVLLLARAKELGLNIPLDLNQVTNVVAHAPGSVEMARALTRMGRAAGVDVAAMNTGGKSIAAWLGTEQKAGPPARRGALGNNASWENQANYQPLYNASQQQPAAARNITDATVVKWFNVWGANKDLPAYHGTGTPESRITFALWWARGKELGLAGTCNPAQMQQYANALPQSQEAADALRRLGAAYGFPVEQLLLGGRAAISTFPKRGFGGAALELAARGALGNGRLGSAQLDKAVEDKDPALFTVGDGGLKSIVEKYPGLAGLQALSADRNWQLGVLDLAERGLAVDVVTPDQMQALLRAVPTRLLDDDVVCERLAAAAARAHLAAGAVVLANGSTLAAHATTKPHVEKLERALQGADAAVQPRRAPKLDEPGGLAAAGPLGNTPGPHSQMWSARDPRMFEYSDDAIRGDFIGYGDYNSWLPHWNNDPRLISLVARIAELNVANGNLNAPAINVTKQWLANPVPEIFGTADALPRVLRAARAAGVEPAAVTVMQGQNRVPLLEHPALAALLQGSAAEVEERAKALAEDLGALDPGANKHPAEREGAALRLLSVTDPEHEIVHTLDELVPAALAALKDGKLARIDLSKVPAKHRDKLLETAFARDEHPAVIALLAGIFFSVDADAVEKLLTKKGHLASVAKEMAQTAASLSARPAGDVAFAALGISKDPPELGSLALRAWLLEDPAPAALQKKLAAGEVDPEALCVAVLERAAAPGTLPARKSALLGVVQKAFDDQLAGRDDVLGALSDEVKAALDATAVQNAADAVQAFLEAGPTEQPAARASLVGALGAASWVDDPNVIAKAALERALDHDLRFVAPLGAVDEAAGGVAGKPWQTRLAKKEATVPVAGLGLPLEGEAQPLAFPIGDEGAGKKNLLQLATRWLAKRPMNIVGADGPDAVRALARATGAALTDVVVKPDTSVHDLVGADGPVSKAVGAGGVVLLRLEGAQWPDGLGPALMAAVPKGRMIATGPALTGFPPLAFAPLDEESVAAHLRAVGIDDEDAAHKVASVFLALRELARNGGAGDVEEGTFPIGLLDRIAARVGRGGGAVDGAALAHALVDVLARRVGGDAQADALAVVEEQVALPESAASLAVDGKSALAGDARLQVVGEPAEAASLPALTSAEVDDVRAAAVALELAEPVVADASLAERVGTLYGALTGRDVHVHLLHPQSTVNDVLGGAGQDVVVVARGFASAPAEVQRELWDAAAAGRIRLVAADEGGAMTSDGLVLRAGPITDDDRAERLRLQARELGVPDAVADGLGDLKASLDDMVTRQEVHPLVDTGGDRDLEGALALVAQLSGAMSTVEAFVAAVSASFPMSTAEEQQKLEDAARRIAES